MSKRKTEVIKIDEWSRITSNGSGDYYVVPESLLGEKSFEDICEEAYGWDDEHPGDKKLQARIEKETIYIGGFADCALFRGEIQV